MSTWLVSFFGGLASNVFGEVFSDYGVERPFETWREDKAKKRFYKGIGKAFSGKTFKPEMEKLLAEISKEVNPNPSKKEKENIFAFGVELSSMIERHATNAEIESYLCKSSAYNNADEQSKNDFWMIVIAGLKAIWKIRAYKSLGLKENRQIALHRGFDEKDNAELVEKIKELSLAIEQLKTSLPNGLAASVGFYPFIVDSCSKCQSKNVVVQQDDKGNYKVVCSACNTVVHYLNPQASNFDELKNGMVKGFASVEQILSAMDTKNVELHQTTHNKLDRNAKIGISILIIVSIGLALGLNECNKPETITVNETSYTLKTDGTFDTKEVEKLGYEFKGLFLNDKQVFDASGKPIHGHKASPKNDYVAVYEETNYAVSFSLNGVTYNDYETSISVYGDLLTEFNKDRPVDEYYERSFYYDSEGKSSVNSFEDFAERFTGDKMDIYVKDTPKNYRVSFKLENETPSADLNIENFSKIFFTFLDDNPYPEYYDKFFTYDQAGEQNVVISDGFDVFMKSLTNATVYVQHTPTEYPITFVYGGQSYSSKVNVETYSDIKESFTDVELEEHYERKIFYDEACEKALDDDDFGVFVSKYTDGMKIYVEDTPIEYSISYSESSFEETENNAKLPKTYSVENSTLNFTTLNQAQKTGYRVKAWELNDKEIEAETVSLDLLNELGSSFADGITLTPIWAPYYSVTVSDNDWKEVSDGKTLDNFNYFDKGSYAFCTNINLLGVVLGDAILDDENNATNFAIDAVQGNIKITITVDVQRVNDGYFQMFLYRSSVLKKVGVVSDETDTEFTATGAKAIEKNKHYTHKIHKALPSEPSTYTFEMVLPKDEVESYKLWIAMDAEGNGGDTWSYRNLNVTLEETEEPATTSIVTKSTPIA